MNTRNFILVLSVILGTCGPASAEYCQHCGHAHADTLTEEDVQRIIREELDRFADDLLDDEEDVAQSSGNTAPVWPSTVTVTTPEIETVTYFNAQLAPYGTWLYLHPYGRVWRPTISVTSRSWQPYCEGGHWIWTDHGWYWQSSYKWGWATFHYGRWMRSKSYGWVWVPGTTWAPSWVAWRQSSHYYGWAPLPPEAKFSLGLGISYTGNSTSFDVHFGLTDSHYVFVERRHFLEPDLACVKIGGTSGTRIYHHTSCVTRPYSASKTTVVNTGISHRSVATSSGRHFDSVRIIRDHPRSQSSRSTRHTSGIMDFLFSKREEKARTSGRTHTSAQTPTSTRSSKAPTQSTGPAPPRTQSSSESSSRSARLRELIKNRISNGR